MPINGAVFQLAIMTRFMDECGKRCLVGYRPYGGKESDTTEWLRTPVFLPGESHVQRSLVGYTVLGVTKSQIQLKQLHIAYMNPHNRNPIRNTYTHTRETSSLICSFWVPVSGVAQLESPGKNRPDQGPESKTGPSSCWLAWLTPRGPSSWEAAGVPVVWRGHDRLPLFILSRRCGRETHTNQWPLLLRHWWRRHPLLISWLAVELPWQSVTFIMRLYTLHLDIWPLHSVRSQAL